MPRASVHKRREAREATERKARRVRAAGLSPPASRIELRTGALQARPGRASDGQLLLFCGPKMRGSFSPQPVVIYSTLGASKSTAHENRTLLC